ncbi:MAG: hypothetical protein KME21_25160 [Desmonostoc vinosum HA7617-LM4]|jgi:hypothetical protein|nr:hypothetical protein [Desmonostoc vinosum HA7617-LM4]
MKRFLTSSVLAVLFLPALLSLSHSSAIAETESSIDEDKLNTVNGMPWASKGLPFSKLVNIKDTLVNSVLGKVVIDIHGEDPLNSLIQSPFSGPRPGRFIVTSLWGSKIEGCFVQMVVQSAPTDGKMELEQLSPTAVELGVGDQIVQFSKNSNTKTRGFSVKYTYTEYENNREREYSNVWYMTDTVFSIDANAANYLRKAPIKEIRARLRFANGDTKVFPLGKGTIKQWQGAYGFNSSCTAPSKL